MMSALRLGRYSAAMACTDCSTTTQRSAAGGRGAGGSAGGGSARCGLPVRARMPSSRSDDDLGRRQRLVGDERRVARAPGSGRAAGRAAVPGRGDSWSPWAANELGEGGGLAGGRRRPARACPPDARTSARQIVDQAALHDRDRLGEPVLEREVAVDGGQGRARSAPGRRPRSTAASTSASLSGKTRKIVPSAMPAASAIWRVVTGVARARAAAGGWRRRCGPPLVGGKGGGTP